MPGRSLQAQVAAIITTLPESQRRVAELVVHDPEAVAFGTLSSVAAAADTSAPTVIRLAAQLGFDGFTALRDTVRDELSTQLHSAVARVKKPVGGALLERALEVERANVERTFAGLDEDDVDRAIDLLADVDRRVFVLPSSQMQGVASHLADDLSLCRSKIVLLEGSEFRMFTVLASLRPGDVLLTVDTQRHEEWLVRVQRAGVDRGAVPIAVTDRLPCSLDLTGGVAITFSCETTSPFESQVGVLSVGNLLISGVVERLRSSVAARVERLEQTWTANGLFDV